MTNLQHTSLFHTIAMFIRHDTEGFTECNGKLHIGKMDLNAEYKMFNGYTKSLVSNWNNNYPLKLDVLKSFVNQETIKIAIEEKYITMPRYKGFSKYQDEIVKLTEKGKRHVLKLLEN